MSEKYIEKSRFNVSFYYDDDFNKNERKNTNGTYSYKFDLNHKGQGFFYNSLNNYDIKLIFNGININSIFMSCPFLSSDEYNLYLIIEEIHYPFESSDFFNLDISLDVDRREGTINLLLGNENT